MAFSGSDVDSFKPDEDEESEIDFKISDDEEDPPPPPKKASKRKKEDDNDKRSKKKKKSDVADKMKADALGAPPKGKNRDKVLSLTKVKPVGSSKNIHKDDESTVVSIKKKRTSSKGPAQWSMKERVKFIDGLLKTMDIQVEQKKASDKNFDYSATIDNISSILPWIVWYDIDFLRTVIPDPLATIPHRDSWSEEEKLKNLPIRGLNLGEWHRIRYNILKDRLPSENFLDM